MKHFLRQILTTTLAIAVVAYFSQSLDYHNNLLVLLTAAICLAILNAFIKPFFKVLFLPINVITLGLFGWLINVIILYLVTLIVPQFDITPFTLNLGNLSLYFPPFFAAVAAAFMVNLVSRLVGWVIA